jgi:hypothetical protein
MSTTPITAFDEAGATVVPVGNTQLPKDFSPTLRVADHIKLLWNLIKPQFKGLDSNHCDGPVAIDKFSFTGAALTKILLASPYSFIYLGTNSAVGCGSNSHYSVQWSVDVV